MRFTVRVNRFGLVLCLLAIAGLACNLSVNQGEGTSDDAGDDLVATQLALQATQIALEQEEEAPTQPPAAQPTQPAPTQAPPTEAPTSEPQPSPTPDIEAMMRSANILVYEDIAGIYEPRYVKQALDGLSLSYTDVADAAGDFKAQLLSGTPWNLIIAAVEARSTVQGEFFVYINDELNKGTAVIIEIWNLNEIGLGKISTILNRCGVEYQQDWQDPPGNRSLWWLSPEHAVLHEPNDGISLVNFTPYWYGDIGDLIELSPGSEATLLAGVYAQEKGRYGTIVSCLDGRLIIQTHSSHDYRQNDQVMLWENYIYNTLKNHFAYASQ